VVTGLRAGDGNATWTVEVHGSDGGSSDKKPAVKAEKKMAVKTHDKTEANEAIPPSGSPGPCVYIIHKLPPKPGVKEGDDPPTIPLKFLTY